ncbi:MAG: hypothetical protein P1U68_11785 [Verrucomicrobiales bacterium]|nr:hypothetical protein [Verrucomicrobiales bacterium]
MSRLLQRAIFLASLMAIVTPFSSLSQDDVEEVTEGARIGTMDSRTSVEEVPEFERWGENDQVSVSGGNPKARAMFGAYVRELRKDFRWSIFKRHQSSEPAEGRDDWEIPIKVELWGDVKDVYRGDDARMSVELRADDRLYIRLAARLHDGFEESEFRLEAVRALVVEQMLAPFVHDPYVLSSDELIAPEWIVHGFDSMIEHRRKGQRSVFYSGVLKSGQFLSPDRLFAVSEPEQLDPISYAIFQISASSMVSALLDQPEGDAGMREFLGDLALSKGVGEFALMKKHFPAFREMEQGLEKWWTLQVATMGQQQRFEFLDWKETERWLTEVLTIRFDGSEGQSPEAERKGKRGLFERFKKEKEPEKLPGPYVGKLGQFPEFIGRKGAREKFTQAFNQLQHVKLVGFPLYRPLLDRYEIVLGKLARGEIKGVAEELAALEQLRTTIRNTIERSEDYLNYFEATQSPQRSDVFDDYMRIRKELERRETPQREDRITRYLDATEQEFR